MYNVNDIEIKAYLIYSVYDIKEKYKTGKYNKKGRNPISCFPSRVNYFVKSTETTDSSTISLSIHVNSLRDRSVSFDTTVHGTPFMHRTVKREYVFVHPRGKY